nr:hypothetical protein asmbl_19 [uncultured bacterium]
MASGVVHRWSSGQAGAARRRPHRPQAPSTGSGRRRLAPGTRYPPRRATAPSCRRRPRGGVDAAVRAGLLAGRRAHGAGRDHRLGRLPGAAGGAVGVRRRGSGGREPGGRGGGLHARRGQRAAPHPAGRRGSRRRPPRRRPGATGLLVSGDRRGGGHGDLHPVRPGGLRLAVPRRRTAGAHRGRRRPRADGAVTRPGDEDGPRPMWSGAVAPGVAGEGFEPS